MISLILGLYAWWPSEIIPSLVYASPVGNAFAYCDDV